jgi:hypothetical protein
MTADPNDVEGGAVDHGKRRDDAPEPSLAASAATSEKLCVLFAAGGTVRQSCTPCPTSRSTHGGGARGFLLARGTRKRLWRAQDLPEVAGRGAQRTLRRNSLYSSKPAYPT